MKTLFAAVAAFQLLAVQPSLAAGKPNIIVILTDDMGYSDLGCYGSEIETPNLDSLAKDGLRFTNFHNTSRCCPTRASLLTGLYSHQAGIGEMTGSTKFPGYQGKLNERCVTLAEVLKPAGYATLMTGKWHVGAGEGHDPMDRGFDRFWGTPSGGGVYFKEALKIRPEIVFHNGREVTDPPDDLYVTDDFTDNALGFIEEAVTETKKPFFLYLAHIAPHWPLQAKPEDIAKYEGRYDVGWDAIREERFARQKEMGIIPANTELSPRDPAAKAWDSMPETARKDLAHRMAVYAGQVDCIDQNIGKLIAKLKELGQFENTLILFLSDNGCSAEGGPGGFSRGKKGAPIGSPESYASVGLEWANASDTPFRKFKADTHQGGIATPLIAHWPAGISENGQLRHQPAHVIDIMPTLVEVSGATYPGGEIKPMEGRSLVPAFKTDSVTARELFWEHIGSKAVRGGDWKAVTRTDKPWQLYDLKSDPTETHDLAKEKPEKTAELAALWKAWAARCDVLELSEFKKKK
jgi:arylsulfatase A-like enzyme